MAQVTLIEHPLSPYAQKVKIALLEKNIPFRILAPMGASEDEQKILHSANPRGEVPVLLDGELSIYDSTIILEYLEDRWPETPLLPAGAAERAHVRTLEEVVDTHLEANSWGLAEVTIYRRATGERANALIQYGKKQIMGWFSWLNRELRDRQYFNGETFGWGDIVVAPYVNDAARFGIAPDPQSNLAAWLARIKERPSVTQTFAEAKAGELNPAFMTAALAAGFKREYRDHRLEWMIRAGAVDIVQAGLAHENIRFTETFWEE
ncbi:glutathione S-transferase family protein [Pseudopontixanthobacter vadosimaris]|uniref:glutathione S-transferase family protein n=1 Tax=Pseudopontixanthobacter vadosimaris TaxID=2726450 RepID=UPI001472CEC3|nr:glutathione S-transferase family protein [Pseudopontixanthobacter vadosimaris]